MLRSSQGPGFGGGGGDPLRRRGAQRSPGRESLGGHPGGSPWQGDPREPCPPPGALSSSLLALLSHRYLFFSSVENAIMKPAPFEMGFNTAPRLGPGCFTSGAANPSLSSCQPRCLRCWLEPRCNSKWINSLGCPPLLPFPFHLGGFRPNRKRSFPCAFHI